MEIKKVCKMFVCHWGGLPSGAQLIQFIKIEYVLNSKK